MEVYINGKKYVEASTQPLTHYTFNDILIANTIAFYDRFNQKYLGRAKIKESFGKSFEKLISQNGVISLSDFDLDSELEQKIINAIKTYKTALKGQVHIYNKNISLAPVGNTNLKFNEIQPAFPIGVFNFYFIPSENFNSENFDNENNLDLNLSNCICNDFRYSTNGNIEIDDIAVYHSKVPFVLSDA